MIKKLIMFTVICDRCGEDSNLDNEHSCWSDSEYAEDVAMEIDWIKKNNNHYCTSCYYFDDEGNEIIMETK